MASLLAIGAAVVGSAGLAAGGVVGFRLWQAERRDPGKLWSTFQILRGAPPTRDEIAAGMRENAARMAAGVLVRHGRTCPGCGQPAFSQSLDLFAAPGGLSRDHRLRGECGACGVTLAVVSRSAPSPLLERLIVTKWLRTAGPGQRLGPLGRWTVLVGETAVTIVVDHAPQPRLPAGAPPSVVAPALVAAAAIGGAMQVFAPGEDAGYFSLVSRAVEPVLSSLGCRIAGAST